MKSNIKCEMIRDILPLYVDNLTCEVTNEEVKKHLEECKECKGVEEIMRKELINEDVVNVNKEIDYLKKVKRKNNTKVALTAAVCGTVLLIILGVLFVRTYIVGNEINYNYASVNEIEVNKGKLHIAGGLSNDGMKVSNIKVEEKDGVVKVRVYEAKKINPKSEEISRYETVEDYKTPIKKVYFGDKVVYEDGVEVERYIADIYNKKVKYVGDNSKVNQLGMTINLGEDNYTIESTELLTTSEPYGIKYTIKINGDHDGETIKEVLKKEGYILLATIDNLGKVCWEGEIKGEKYEFVVEETEADGEMQKSIKEYGKSAKALQELYNYLENN